jgi:hypothetical protein
VVARTTATGQTALPRIRAAGVHAYGRWIWTLTVWWATWGWAADAAPDTAPETSVKAAFIYKFLSYIEWPAGMLVKDAPVTIGVLGAEQIATELRQLAAGRTVDGHPVQVKVLTRNAPLSGVQVLFIGETYARTQPVLASAAGARSIATVTENNDTTPEGCIINLVMVEGRVRFDVSLPAARRAGVKLSSRLLSVARVVQAEAP